MEEELLRYDIEVKEKWKEWCRKIPYIHFKEEWDVRIIPAFGGALTRFTIDYNKKHVSVYLDVYSRLGWMYEGEDPIPYFEVYPIGEDLQPSRYYLNDVDEMMKDIDRELNREA